MARINWDKKKEAKKKGETRLGVKVRHDEAIDHDSMIPNQPSRHVSVPPPPSSTSHHFQGGQQLAPLSDSMFKWTSFTKDVDILIANCADRGKSNFANGCFLFSCHGWISVFWSPKICGIRVPVVSFALT